MNVKSLLFLCGLLVGASACMGQTRPAPDTSPLPDAASIAEHSAVQARRLEAERRSGVIFETSRPGKTLVDGQPTSLEALDLEKDDAEKPAEEAVDPEAEAEKPSEDAPAGAVESEQPVDSGPVESHE